MIELGAMWRNMNWLISWGPCLQLVAAERTATLRARVDDISERLLVRGQATAYLSVGSGRRNRRAAAAASAAAVRRPLPPCPMRRP